MNLPLNAKQLITFVSFSFWIVAIGGCTSQSWYEGVKRGAENNCRNQPPSEVDRCLENLNKKTYEEYEKERANQK